MTIEEVIQDMQRIGEDNREVYHAYEILRQLKFQHNLPSFEIWGSRTNPDTLYLSKESYDDDTKEHILVVTNLISGIVYRYNWNSDSNTKSIK